MHEVHFSFKAMGGKNEIWFYAPNELDQFKIADEAINLVLYYESKYSRFNETSFLSIVNNAAGKDRIRIDDETALLLNYANACYIQSGGLFDITSGILRRIWDFKKKEIPSQESIKKTKKLIDWSKVSITSEGIFLPLEGMEIDLGGIVKEYTSDKVASFLLSKKITNAFINLGGDIHIIGSKPNSVPWIIGIQHPRKPGETLASLSMLKGAIATSGDYERYFEKDGKRYCHIMNPKIGYPVLDLQSVTVCAESCLVAGSLSTIAMLLGEVKAIPMLRDSGYPFFAVNRDGKIISKGPFTS